MQITPPPTYVPVPATYAQTLTMTTTWETVCQSTGFPEPTRQDGVTHYIGGKDLAQHETEDTCCEEVNNKSQDCGYLWGKGQGGDWEGAQGLLEHWQMSLGLGSGNLCSLCDH